VIAQGQSPSGYEAFYWRNGVRTGLGDLPGGSFLSTPFDVSAEGSVIVGYGFSTAGLEAWRWTQATGMVGLGDLPGGSHISYAQGVSADGSVVVGQGHSGPTLAFRWTQATGLVSLGELPGGSVQSSAWRTSADGSVVIGVSNSASGSEAFRWTQETGMVGLGDLPGGAFQSSASAITPDGTKIVGTSSSAAGTEAYLWTAATGMVPLGDLPGGLFESYAYDVSADGKTIVGTGAHEAGPPLPPGASVREAVLWDPRFGGVQEVDVVLQMLGLDISGWTLTEAVGVSADGMTIVGTGYHNGVQGGWIAVIPEPGTGLLVAGGLLLLTALRRR